MIKIGLKYIFLIATILLLASCSVTKYVPEDQTLLNKIHITSEIPDITPSYLNSYVKQKPNNYLLGIWRMQLGLYNMSGEDETKWYNRWLRRIGEEPVLYDSIYTQQSIEELEKVLFNRGYMNADVTTSIKEKNQKVKLTYIIDEKIPYKLGNYEVIIPNEDATRIIEKRINIPERGIIFDIDVLNEERTRIATRLRNQGYYNFQKELLYISADSTVGDYNIDAKLSLQPQFANNDSALNIIFTKKTVEEVTIIAIKDAALNTNLQAMNLDTVYVEGFRVIYDPENETFRPRTLISKTYIQPNSVYNERLVDRTYSQMTSLNAVKYVNITFNENANGNINALVLVTQDKPNSISLDGEFTYSSGDLGVGGGIGYKNNNIFNGAEILSIGIDGGYEALGGNLTDIQSSTDIGGEVSLTFPHLLIPSRKEYYRRMIGSTVISTSVNFQQRPEYDRNIANAGIKYNWTWKRINFTYNLVDISYIYLPRMSEAFEELYMQPTSSIRFSYEDQFIMQMGLGVSYSSKRNYSILGNYYTIRASVKSAGNLLYGLSNLFNQEKNEDGSYELFNISYSQYAKADFDYAYNMVFSEKSRLVFHTALGVGVPYCNASILPFEERYYSGGANSMRGWSARTLGPGNFYNSSGSIDYMKQSGDIKLDLNLEARFKLIWKLETAFFVDAGNIWTIQDYEEQPTGYFQWGEFYKQIACSYGMGLRLDFSFFVIRVDFGIKLYDPGQANISDRWRTNLTADDFAFHFAVGYPF